jgi:hypothetical protein
MYLQLDFQSGRADMRSHCWVFLVSLVPIVQVTGALLTAEAK